MHIHPRCEAKGPLVRKGKAYVSARDTEGDLVHQDETGGLHDFVTSWDADRYCLHTCHMIFTAAPSERQQVLSLFIPTMCLQNQNQNQERKCGIISNPLQDFHLSNAHHIRGREPRRVLFPFWLLTSLTHIKCSVARRSISTESVDVCPPE